MTLRDHLTDCRVRCASKRIEVHHILAKPALLIFSYSVCILFFPSVAAPYYFALLIRKSLP